MKMEEKKLIVSKKNEKTKEPGSYVQINPSNIYEGNIF